MGHGGGNGGAWEGRHLLRDIKQLCLLLAKLVKVASQVALHLRLAPSNALLALVELEFPRLELACIGWRLRTPLPLPSPPLCVTRLNSIGPAPSHSKPRCHKKVVMGRVRVGCFLLSGR